MGTEEIKFLPTDFEKFADSVQDNAEFNDARLEVRRKLDLLGKAGGEKLSDGVHDFVSRASLHHPHKVNSFKVDKQWVYLSRAESERKELQGRLGQEIGEDLGSDYNHAVLVLEIQHSGLTLALRIHPRAWWDGENLRRQMGRQEGRENLAAAVKPLKGFRLRIDDNKTSRACETVDEIEWMTVRKHFTPGEHWMHIEKHIDGDSLFVSSGGFQERLLDEWSRLLPAYKLFCWHKNNDELFA
ncbi:MAG: hypothetical protein P8R38_04510 [Planctomycetota bacterium]|nr:hypothetical protein [Planctomycetota bacterium]MDG2083721.1 hypothetical protein [Planctomycetota bacterium]